MRSETNLKQLTGKLAYMNVLAFCLLCIMAIGISYGFLTDQNAVTNNIICGCNDAVIEEEFGEYEEFVAGKKYTKKVSVKNEGEVPCYVRVFAEVTEPDTADKMTVDLNTTDWTTKQSDGYYYYRKVLEKGEKTEPLFTTITANKDITDFEMICYSESVQSEGFSTAKAAFAAIK